MEPYNEYSLCFFQHKVFEIHHVIECINDLSLSSAKGIPPYDHTAVCLSTLLLMEHLGCCQLGVCDKQIPEMFCKTPTSWCIRPHNPQDCNCG